MTTYTDDDKGSGVGVLEEAADEISVSAVWRSLVGGEVEVVEEFTEGQTIGMVLSFKRSPRVLFSARNLDMLQRLLGGTCSKVLAIDFGLSMSTVAQILKGMLQAMGFMCSPARVSPLLVLLAYQARSTRLSGRLRVERTSRAGVAHLTVCTELDNSAFARLAPAEKAVLWQRIFGRSLADIAASRKTSERTVANQIAHAYGRLGVSGRLDLLQLLAV